MSRKTLIVNGDSWTFGSEILNPELERFSNIVTEQDFEQNNDSYRIPRIYPTHLSKLMDVDLINLSWPADDNKSILKKLILSCAKVSLSSLSLTARAKLSNRSTWYPESINRLAK